MFSRRIHIIFLLLSLGLRLDHLIRYIRKGIEQNQASTFVHYSRKGFFSKGKFNFLPEPGDDVPFLKEDVMVTFYGKEKT
jgi:hypothetical protein